MKNIQVNYAKTLDTMLDKIDAVQAAIEGMAKAALVMHDIEMEEFIENEWKAFDKAWHKIAETRQTISL
jgi:hypothetical protein